MTEAISPLAEKFLRCDTIEHLPLAIYGAVVAKNFLAF